jgi:hypothetical protein
MFQSTCGCCASRRDFIELVNELSIVTRDGHWTRVAPFTHPFQWTCRADAIQRTLLSANSIGNYALDRTEKDSTSGKRAIKPKQKNTSRARDSADLVILNARIFTGIALTNGVKRSRFATEKSSKRLPPRKFPV